ncbi:anthranilate synthase component I family protein [Halobellus limi]|uniref:anthranilate synthase n=1 Tax=Halobellus limi TaxID=699433 RepID=A0A1H6CUW8_9EURY|nr:anthranilate synthase component I family protein [Halobellus limi]QCC49144.1 anthranilate synthase component I family protein [Halobellus limi]SEG76305.1 anthranilate synthase component 1 [Halobellus limi]
MSEITVITQRDEFVETAASEPVGVRIPVEVRTVVQDPFEAYRRVRTEDEDGVYLETTGGQSGWGYFAVDPVEHVSVPNSAVDPDVSAGDASAGRSESATPTLEAIDSLLDRERLVRGDCDVPYPCGAFGWLSYDVARELESLPDTTENDGLPQLQLGVFDAVVAWQEPRAARNEPTSGTDGRTPKSDGIELRITVCPVVDESPEETYRTALDRATSLAESAASGPVSTPSPAVDADRATFESECGEDEFAERVRTIKRYIRDGDTFQTNVSHRLVAPAAVHPIQAFDAVRRVNPAPYSGLLEFPGIDLVSASPELLLEVDGDRLLTEPIAGTRPRGDTPEADAELEADLLADEKERAEHAMLVDLERNDLGKVSEYGTVDVSEYRRVDRYSEVMHLVSLVEGTRRAGTTVADAVAAVFPGGTITGAPKPRTMEIIDEVERTRRGPYTGSIGIFGFDDRATLNIVIRTLVRRGDEYRLRVGAGIVHDSVPSEEYQETLDKARALINAVDEALGERASFAVETGTEVGPDGAQEDPRAVEAEDQP